MKKITLDANIFIKMFKAENDSKTAIELIQHTLEQNYKIIVPAVMVNEVMTTLEYHKIDTSNFMALVTRLIKNKNMVLVSSSLEVINKTLEITKQGHIKSGFPTFNDSMFHAVALLSNTVFITADKRHLSKTKNIGKIAILNDWYQVI